ncbi:MAG: hypothetical protein NZ602_14260 [Thermoguttaceae bacterium]|nr:hypothetical protein [Thermoguttaceae bacterium]MDW8039612.1 hypothetical protein [Thermoguttaceae bacterium]
MGTLYSSLLSQVGWSWQSGTDAAPVVDNNRLMYRKDLEHGQEAFAADVVWHAEGQQLDQGESRTYDLQQMAFEVFGDKVIICFHKVRAMAIVHRGQKPGLLQVGGAATAAWQGPLAEPGAKIQIPAQGAFWAAAPEEGWPVSAQACQLRLEALGGDVLYDMVLLGNRPENSSSS